MRFERLALPCALLAMAVFVLMPVDLTSIGIPYAGLKRYGTYILTLWLRYLKSRRQAYICIICVMLGVATLIVVNGVMSGFSTKLQGKLHDMQSDIVIESTNPMAGFPVTIRCISAELVRDRETQQTKRELVASLDCQNVAADRFCFFRFIE